MENNEKLYKFIYPNSNDKLLNLSGSDLRKLFNLINSSYLGLRDKLGIDESNSFGMEIESENINDFERLKGAIEKSGIKLSWDIGHDLSLTKGMEVKSPISTDKEVVWQDLNKVCSVMRKYSKIDKNAGGHVHVGAHILGDDLKSWANFIRFWGVYENIIFRFSSGEFLTHRPHLYRYAEPVAGDFLEKYIDFDFEVDNLYFLLHQFECQEDRDFAVNLSNIDFNNPKTLKNRNTIEFRCPNGTLDPAIWQNNVNFFVKMLNYSKNPKYDSDTINRRYNSVKRKEFDLYDYGEIYLNQMLELCDLIFDNNLDKLYFIKQYLKSFEVYNGEDYIKTKRKIFMG